MYYSSLRRKIDLFWRKNGSDIKATLSGSLFNYFSPKKNQKAYGKIPVLVFHTVDPNIFEKQLIYLTENNYTSIDCETLLDLKKGNSINYGRLIALTFDDANCSFWTIAFPLLKKYNLRAILFVAPGLISNANTISPNLIDVWAGQAKLGEILNRSITQPLCTWPELKKMYSSGLIDIQPHSLTHSRINISSKVVDFVNPSHGSNFFRKLNIPVPRTGCAQYPVKHLPLGQPIYESRSRLSGYSRFWEDHYASEKLMKYVLQEGGESFFSRPGWRKELIRKHKIFLSENKIETSFEQKHEVESAIIFELIRSREILQEYLGGKPFKHLCYPWFDGSPLSDRLALQCGYHSVFYGQPSDSNTDNHDLPLKVQRLSEEYLFCLDGHDQKSIASVWINKMFKIIKN